MSKPIVMIADTDETYLATLEEKFLLELNEKIELEVISDVSYFEKKFATPTTAEIVVVDEKLYTGEMQKHNIANLFVLTEEKENGNTTELAVNRVYKYLGVRELFNELTYQSMEKIAKNESSHKDTEVIALYSAVGGTGKTSLSVGLARCLAIKHKKVLYLNTESVQEFSYYLEDKTGMPGDGYRAMKSDLNHSYHNIRHFIRNEKFYYIPPFLTTLDARNLEFGIYKTIIQGAKESKEYDFIIVDIEAGYSSLKVNLLQEADRVMLITQQDAISTYKMQYMTGCLDFGDKEKYMVICNKYDNTKENAYFQSDMQSKFPIKEYVEYVSEPLETAEQLAGLNGIEKLSYMFI